MDDIRSDSLILAQNDTRCAPTIDFSHGSCINLPILIEMAKAYNKEHPDNQIKLNESLGTLNPSKYKKYILKNIRDKMSDKCSTQYCWTQQDFINNMNIKVQEELRKYVFRPEGPEGKFEWLNTLHINDVMEQYERKYNDFKYLGAVPIDFDKLPMLGFTKLDFAKMSGGDSRTKSNSKTKLGVVFNLDEHDQPGSHWVSMYADIQKGGIYFWDSVGTMPDPRIRAFMRRIAKYCEFNGIKVDSRHNQKRNQFGGSECGVYSINFILRMLENKGDFDKVTSTTIPDKEINKYRDIYFVNTNHYIKK